MTTNSLKAPGKPTRRICSPGRSGMLARRISATEHSTSSTRIRRSSMSAIGPACRPSPAKSAGLHRPISCRRRASGSRSSRISAPRSGIGFPSRSESRSCSGAGGGIFPARDRFPKRSWRSKAVVCSTGKCCRRSFPDAQIVREKFAGLTKSFTAIRTRRQAPHQSRSTKRAREDRPHAPLFRVSKPASGTVGVSARPS